MTKGIIKSIPGIELLFHKRPGSTVSSRYCYAVWMRHLVNAMEEGMKEIPSSIAELGPGGTAGVGLAALLSGSNHYHALDVVSNWNVDMNLMILDELIELFNARERIPDNEEFPKITTPLKSYEFPSTIITEQILEKTLSEDRIGQIRSELRTVEKKSNQMIRYIIPWRDNQVMKPQSLDLVYSQAVLEHVEDPKGVYCSMHSWLKPGGFMSHEIDFKSHGSSKMWNGHWSYTDFQWRIVKGRYQYLINRLPYSAHLDLLKKSGFGITRKVLNVKDSELDKKNLAPRFSGMNDKELTTSSMYVQSIKS